MCVHREMLCLFNPQVNIVFQKVAADILGIKLTRPDLEQQQRVVKAEIVTYKHAEAKSRPVQQQPKSSFCSLQ